MKKPVYGFVASLAVALASASASAGGFLYCMIEDASDIYNDGAPITFDYATISIDGGDNYLYFYNTSGASTGNQMASEESTTKSGYYSSVGAGDDLPYYAKIESAESDYTAFLFQLWSEEGDVVGWRTYDKGYLADHIFDNTSMTGDSAFVVSRVIPEPTSGLLMLFGLAGLALRRRKA